MNARHTRKPWLALLVPALLASAACEDGVTDPTGSEFDPEAAAASLEGITGFDDDGVLTSLDLAGSALADASGPGAAGATVQGFGGGSEPMVAFPTDAYGSTYVWKPQQGGRYEIADSLEGAPENGVRFLYYAMENGEPIEDEILGYVDLTDEDDNTTGTNRLGIFVASTVDADTVPLVDYGIEGSYTIVEGDTTLNIGADGFISNGTDSLSFVLDHAGTVSGTDTVAWEGTHTFERSADGATAALTATGQSLRGQDGYINFDGSATITKEPDDAVLDLVLDDEGNLEGSVTHNGELVIEIDGTTQSPIFEQPDGTELTEAQQAALVRMHLGFVKLRVLAHRLFHPIERFDLEN